MIASTTIEKLDAASIKAQQLPLSDVDEEILSFRRGVDVADNIKGNAFDYLQKLAKQMVEGIHVREIAPKLGVSRQRVRQIQNDALRKHRHPIRKEVPKELL